MGYGSAGMKLWLSPMTYRWDLVFLQTWVYISYRASHVAMLDEIDEQIKKGIRCFWCHTILSFPPCNLLLLLLPCDLLNYMSSMLYWTIRLLAATKTQERLKGADDSALSHNDRQTLLFSSPSISSLLPCDLLNYMSMYCHSSFSYPPSRVLWGLRAAIFVRTDQPSQNQIICLV